MRVRRQDTNGDSSFGQSAQNFEVNSVAGVAQIVETVLKLWLGEWYLNLNAGTPYPDGVVGKHSQATADQTLIAQVTNIEWVTSLQNWKSTVNPNTRRYSSVSATLFTPFGQTQLQINNLENA